MSDKVISVIINVDTRPGFMDMQTDFNGMFNGARSLDFLIEGVLNKKKFFDGYDHDVTLFIDYHERIPRAYEEALLNMLNNGQITNLVFNRHTEYFQDRFTFKWNDINFLNAIMMGRGKYIAHFDGDTAAFRKPGSTAIDRMMQWLDEDIEYVSYPSNFSPGETGPEVFDQFRYWWASTRFFFGKRESIDYTEIVKCLQSDEYLYGKYGDRRRCPWLENILGIITYDKGKKVYYPPMSSDYMIFCWGRYYSGVLPRLNQMSYEDVDAYIGQCGGISYPCDVYAKPL
jgi:hypothetical protein